VGGGGAVGDAPPPRPDQRFSKMGYNFFFLVFYV